MHFRDEPFIVELTGKNNRSFVFANTDGLGGGQLGGDDTLSFCYRPMGDAPGLLEGLMASWPRKHFVKPATPTSQNARSSPRANCESQFRSQARRDVRRPIRPTTSVIPKQGLLWPREFLSMAGCPFWTVLWLRFGCC